MVDDSGAGAQCGGYETRSHLMFAFLTSAIRAGLADAAIIDACLDPHYAGKGIFEHITENGGRPCAERQLQRAHDKVREQRGSGTTTESIHSWDEPGPVASSTTGAASCRTSRSTCWSRNGCATGWSSRRTAPAPPSTTWRCRSSASAPASSATPAACRRSRPGHQPLTEWTCTIGYSGSGKTPGLDATRLPLDDLEAQRSTQNADLKRAHDRRTAQAALAKSAWEKEAKKAIQERREPPPMPNAAFKPDEYVEPRLFTTDATIEKLAVLLQARPQGMLLVMDELAGLFHNMSALLERARTTSSGWRPGTASRARSTAWRSGRSIRVRNLLIGMVGGLQPDKLAEVFKGAADGMYARFLFSWPPTPPYRELDDTHRRVFAADHENARPPRPPRRQGREHPGPAHAADQGGAGRVRGVSPPRP